MHDSSVAALLACMLYVFLSMTIIYQLIFHPVQSSDLDSPVTFIFEKSDSCLSLAAGIPLFSMQAANLQPFSNSYLALVFGDEFYSIEESPAK